MHIGLQLPPVTDFDAILRNIEAAERADFDFVWLPESQTLSAHKQEGRLPYDATLLASALAARSERIGILVTAAPARHEPYNLARRLASLDWISHGRIGWTVDAGADTARDEEYVGLVRDLWDSWDDNAFIHDKGAGRFFNPDKMHVINHRGPHFSVRGPLNVDRPPQGHPVIAALADAVISAQADVVLVPENLDPPASSKSVGKRLLLGGWSSFGDPPQRLVDQFEATAERSGLGGFVVAPLTSEALARFIAEVMPEIVRRGLISSSDRGQTLRDRLGLPRPALPALEVSA